MNLYLIENLTSEGIEFYQMNDNDPKVNGPFYKLSNDDIGEIVNELPIDLIFADTHLPATKVDIIRRNYSIDDEFKIINKGIANSEDIDYVIYRNFVDSI